MTLFATELREILSLLKISGTPKRITRQKPMMMTAVLFMGLLLAMHLQVFSQRLQYLFASQSQA